MKHRKQSRQYTARRFGFLPDHPKREVMVEEQGSEAFAIWQGQRKVVALN